MEAIAMAVVGTRTAGSREATRHGCSSNVPTSQMRDATRGEFQHIIRAGSLLCLVEQQILTFSVDIAVLDHHDGRIVLRYAR